MIETYGDAFFGKLAKSDEEKVEELIARYGYARMIAAVIRKMDKEAGKVLATEIKETAEELGLYGLR